MSEQSRKPDIISARLLVMLAESGLSFTSRTGEFYVARTSARDIPLLDAYFNSAFPVPQAASSHEERSRKSIYVLPVAGEEHSFQVQYDPALSATPHTLQVANMGLLRFVAENEVYVVLRPSVIYNGPDLSTRDPAHLRMVSVDSLALARRIHNNHKALRNLGIRDGVTLDGDTFNPS